MNFATVGTLLIGLTSSTQIAGGNSAPAAAAKQDAAHATKTTASDSKSTPSAAVLDYLGQYEDAAEGFDPLGFDDNTIENSKPATADKKADKQGTGP
jgi:hypothetical protein